jgi:epoxyqueuosine reductase QueG
MMLRIHPEHGLWHAYRFALALPMAPRALTGAVEAGISAPEAVTLDLAGRVAVPTSATDLCATCIGQPCLQACPVGAYTGESFLLNACASHLHSQAGAECMQNGCLARHACPVAAGKRYSQEHAAFHMQAFARNH